MATLGITQTNSTSSAFGGTQTTYFGTPVDLSVTEVLWDLSQSGTYELRIDGTLINTRTGVSGIGVDMLSGASTPITITRGDHIIKITKTSGSNGWYYRTGGNAYVDPPWFFAGYWQEAGGNEVVPFRITATPAETLIRDGPPTSAPWIAGGVDRTAETYTITWDTNVLAYGIIATWNGFTPYELLVDGVVVGTTTGTYEGNDIALPGRVCGLILDDPIVFVNSLTYTIKLRRVSTVDFQGQIYVTGSTYSNTYFDQTVWQEPPAGTTPAIQWLFAETEITSGTMAGTFPSITGTIAGTIIEPVDGVLAGNWGSLNGTITGTVVPLIEGTMTGNLGGLTGAAVGGVRLAVDGTMTGTFGALTGTITQPGLEGLPWRVRLAPSPWLADLKG